MLAPRTSALVGLLVACFAAGCGGSGQNATSGGTAGAGGDGGGGAASTGTETGGGGSATGGSGGTTTGTGGGPAADNDGDGLDDAFEEEVAKTYLPFLSLDPDDGCPLGGMLFRVSPHPKDPALLFVLYDHLYETDCGIGGHTGDNEAFGVAVDPSKAPPEGILSIKAIGHQNTFCEKVSECGSCAGLSACPTTMLQGQSWPVVYSSKDKHASYVDESKCTLIDVCPDSCSLAPETAVMPMLNAGEPNGHLTDDLTTNGFITDANGWTQMELFHYDPWETTKDFGGAGNVAGDLVDMAFVPSCP